MTFGSASSRCWLRLAAAGWLVVALAACSIVQFDDPESAAVLRETNELVERVRAFSRTLGVESGPSFSRSTYNAAPLSMLWLWLQREGTLALGGAVDIRMAVGFRAGKERIPLERVYRVSGYSVYFRQGNEFADPRAVVTASFAAEELVRRVNVIVHEDLHDPKNFDLPWEVEESIVTPLGSLVAIEFFRSTGDENSFRAARERLEEERRLARELNALAAEAEVLFKNGALHEARKKILARFPFYSTYDRHFQHQVAGQDITTVLEAKLSHDLAYFRNFDTIVALAEAVQDLRVLIEDLKKFSRSSVPGGLESYLQELKRRYRARTQNGSVPPHADPRVVSEIIGR